MSIPPHLLERYRLGELSPAEHAALEARMDDGDRAQLAALQADDEDILKRYPPRVMAIAIEQKRKARKARWVAPTVGSAMVLLGAAAAMTVALNADFSTDGLSEAGFQADPGVGIRIKDGGARVLVYLEGQSDDPLEEDASVSEGDTVQLAVNVGGDRYAALVSLDGRGVVTPHLPTQGGDAIELQANETLLLPTAYTLDDAPQFERFFLVTSASPFSVGTVSQAVQELGGTASPDETPLNLPEALHVQEHLLRKVAR